MQETSEVSETSEVCNEFAPMFDMSLSFYWCSLKMDTFVNKKGEYQPPLSWKLTQRQKDAIKKGWEVLRTEAGGVVEQIEAIWKDWAARKSDPA